MASGSAPSEPRWRQRADQRPGEIIAAALDLFAEKGFAATKIEDIAARAGLSKAGVYLYFPSKEEVFKAAVRETILGTVGRMEAMARNFEGDSAELLRRVVGHIAAMIVTPAGAIPKIVLSEAGNFPDIAEFYAREVISRGFRLIQMILTRGVARGEFAEVTPRTPFLVIAPMLTLAMWNHGLGRVLGQPLEPEAFAEEVTRVLCRGLAAGEAKS